MGDKVLARRVTDEERTALYEVIMKHADAATLPRIALRAAIEHLDKDQRAAYLGKKTGRQLTDPGRSPHLS